MKKKSESENTEELIDSDSLPSLKKDRGISSLLLRCCVWRTSSGGNHSRNDENDGKQKKKAPRSHPDPDPLLPHLAGTWGF